ncbi:helix-turn-helix domain-containing protein [Mycobacterium malmoense]|uniref:Transcriptional regulator n=1 Tax=Mycobacterium malmoense TaxID=1780 RepID=A0ABX3SNJ4_MYCMA|nr:helix-turn-helix domain-containing protein [Mycobacterium malmoense]OIN82187.1 transcriptional regulator [Mycobacterium malmoense]ORA80000.1 transcriptional regulator [Mycobacterium malmoense]QZA19313.1 helix-turn-helix domain-containing protein [Mycobacterium malmoense]UNB96070.1 helix-turn-helix domain-containing protein [Mycobacterium malmoense]
MSDIRAVGEPTGRRREVLRLLRSSPVPMSIVAIADELGVHPNTVRFHLDSLVGDGQVEQVEAGRKGPGRPALMFQAIRQMDRSGTRHYRVLAEILTLALAAERNPRAKAMAAGREWGRKLDASLESPPGGATSADDAIDHLVGMLDELGFAPERRTSDGEQQVGLRHCPFLELAETRGSVVCPIHLGLMQGALETWAAPVSVDRLDAFVEPDLCLAHIAPVGAAG